MTAIAAADGTFRIGPIAPDTYFEVIGHLGGEIGWMAAEGTTEACVMADVPADSSATGQVVKDALIARRLFERDEKDAARAVIEPAIEALRQPFDRVESDAASGRSHAHHPVAAAAHLLSVAEVIDPEAFEGWQQHALGLPRRPAGFTPLRLEGLINTEACLAIALADRSPAIARAIIDP